MPLRAAFALALMVAGASTAGPVRHTWTEAEVDRLVARLQNLHDGELADLKRESERKLDALRGRKDCA